MESNREKFCIKIKKPNQIIQYNLNKLKEEGFIKDKVKVISVFFV